jgi:hypothetical protein
MGVASMKTSDVAWQAVNTYSMPELQRELVWKVEDAAVLIDSLLRGYSIGAIQLWSLKGSEPVQTRSTSNRTPTAGSLLVIDGQQRSTALAALCVAGTPDWVSSQKERERFDAIRNKVCFSLRDMKVDEAGIRLQKQGSYLVPVHKICTSQGEEDLQRLTRAALPAEATETEVLAATYQLLKVKDQVANHDIAVETRSLSLGEAVEAFTRLNGRGISLSQSDLVLAAFGHRVPGFARDFLKPYVEVLVDRNLVNGHHGKIQDAVLRSLLTGLQLEAGMVPAVRFADIDFANIPFEKVGNYWPKVKAAWDKVLAYLDDRGVDASSIRGLNELAPLVMLTIRFPDLTDVNDPRLADAWLYMRRADRYAKQSTDAHAADADLLKVETVDEAIKALVCRTVEERQRKFKAAVPRYTAAELLGDLPKGKLHTSGLDHAYVLALSQEARLDPTNRGRLFLTSATARKKGAGKNCHWHHVVPQNLIRQLALQSPEWVNSAANLTLVDAETNIAWSDKAPAVYLSNIRDENLIGQGFDLATGVKDFATAEEFVQARAVWLAELLNAAHDRLEASAGISPAVTAP